MNHFSDPNAEKPENVRSVNPFKNWLTWCQSCRHGGHSDHISDWFELVINFAFGFQGGNLYSWVYKATLDNNKLIKKYKKKTFCNIITKIWFYQTS